MPKRFNLVGASPEFSGPRLRRSERLSMSAEAGRLLSKKRCSFAVTGLKKILSFFIRDSKDPLSQWLSSAVAAGDTESAARRQSFLSPIGGFFWSLNRSSSGSSSGSFGSLTPSSEVSTSAASTSAASTASSSPSSSPLAADKMVAPLVEERILRLARNIELGPADAVLTGHGNRNKTAIK